MAEEKANARESSYKEQIKTLTAKLKQETINENYDGENEGGDDVNN